jgi:acyl-CoA synthetase (NDP forming)
MATPDDTVDALFRQSGVIRVDTLEELFDVADVLEHQPLPRGKGVGIVGNAGGPGVLAADACEGYGLAVPELSPRTQSQLRSILSPGAAVANPVDCIASATAEQYRRALEIVLAYEARCRHRHLHTAPGHEGRRRCTSGRLGGSRCQQADRGELLRQL